MNLRKKLIKHWILIVILIAAFTIRFYRVDEVPPGMSHDELEYVNNGYSIFKTGRDLYGDFLPVSIGGVGYVAIPAYLAGLPTLFFGLNEWSVRIMPVLFGTADILLLYGISKLLLKKEGIALWSAFILATTNWGIKISRVMLDPPTALFFYLLGIFMFIKSTQAKSSPGVLTALGVLCLGMLSYYGAVFIFPGVILALGWYGRKYLRSNKKVILKGLIVLGVGVLVLSLMLFKPHQNSRSAGRMGELIFFNPVKITDNVIYSRLLSEGPSWFDYIYLNKAAYIFKTFFGNYIGAFSLNMIFVSGDPNRAYGLWDRGEISLFLLPFIVYGVFVLHSKFREQRILVFLLILVAPITSGLTGRVYATRAFLLWPFLVLLSGIGIWKVFVWFKTNKPGFYKLAIVCFVLVHVFTFFGFINQYFFRYPVYAKEIWFDSEKQLAFYLMDHKDEKIAVYSLEGRQAFMEYMFFSNLDPKIAQKALDKTDIKADIQVANIKFVNGCFDPDKDFLEVKTIIKTDCSPLDVGKADDWIKARDKSDAIKWAIFTPKKK